MIRSRFKITDDSGFMALVNAETYNSYVKEDWELSDLIERFVTEMNNNSLIIWATGFENTWTVDILQRPLARSVFREFSKIIKVTENSLYLTNYEDLSMAAQFADEPLPANHNSDLKIEIENGFYDVTVRQISDPASDSIFDEEVNFELVFERIRDIQAEPYTETIFWME